MNVLLSSLESIFKNSQLWIKTISIVRDSSEPFGALQPFFKPDSDCPAHTLSTIYQKHRGIIFLTVSRLVDRLHSLANSKERKKTLNPSKKALRPVVRSFETR